MSERKLTPEQIDELFDFCRKHYVQEYDMQIELVDHLASSIEKQWKTNPEIPFPVARINTFEKFGIYGFSKIKEQKEKELRRKYQRLFWQYTLEFYKLPKVILTIALTVVLFSIYRFVNSFYWVTVPLFASIIVFDLFYLFWFYPKKYKIKTIDKKPFLLINYLNSRQVGVNLIFQIPLQGIQAIDRWNYSFLNSELIMGVASLVLVTLGIFIYVYFIVLPIRIKEHFVEQFPQFIVT